MLHSAFLNLVNLQKSGPGKSYRSSIRPTTNAIKRMEWKGKPSFHMHQKKAKTFSEPLGFQAVSYLVQSKNAKHERQIVYSIEIPLSFFPIVLAFFSFESVSFWCFVTALNNFTTARKFKFYEGLTTNGRKPQVHF